MQLTFDNYWPLLLLGLIPYLWWVQRRTMVDLSSKHLLLSGLVRSAVVFLIALALMQPVLHRPGVWLSVVYLLDVSLSVSPPAIQSAMDWLQETDASGSPAHSQFIAFGENSAVFDSLEQLRNVEVSTRPLQNGAIDQSGTNIQEAVDRALRSFAPHHLKRLVLLTDGNETTGQASSLLARLNQERVRIYAMPMAARANGDIWVEAIMAPSRVTAEELFPLEVHVYSQVDASGEIEIRNGETTLDTRNVELQSGLNRIAFETRITEETGPVMIEAEARIPNDPFPENNRFRQAIVVQGQPRVLYVEGRPESARYLEQALKIEGFTVDLRPPDAIPETVDGLDAYDALILSDVAHRELNDRQMQSIATYVGDLGGGFILSGGENNYGEGGYSGTVIEEVLPVTFDTKQEESDTIAMIVVLDKSGSMGGQKMELAKEATKAPLDLMKDSDRFGVVAFDYNFYWPVEFQSVLDKEAIRLSISRIMAGGETNIYPALREAYIQLADAVNDIKHVILLSDGRSLPDDYQSLVLRMATDKITVSTVAIGAGADRELLANIAEWGEGRTYYLDDAENVPQIFTEETQIATGKTLREESFQALVKKDVEAFKGIDFDQAPPLLGYVSTKAKETSEILLESGDEEPILVRWQYGLGKTVAFTSDLKDRWAAEWLQWDGYGKFWSQLVRDTMRRSDDQEFDFQVDRVHDRARIKINAIHTDGTFRNKLQSEVRIVAPDQSITVVDVHQTGPGSYEASFPLAQKGSYLFRATDQESSGASRLLAYSFPREYHFYPPNTDLLRGMSEQTGGIFQPRPESIFASNGESTALPSPLWPYFVALALVLYITDVFLRRVRLFEE